MQVGVFFYSFLGTFRFQTAQQFFFMITNLDLYRYHSTNYTGFFKVVLDYINIFQDSMWTFLNLKSVEDFINNPFPLPSYSAFTNSKY